MCVLFMFASNCRKAKREKKMDKLGLFLFFFLRKEKKRKEEKRELLVLSYFYVNLRKGKMKRLSRDLWKNQNGLPFYSNSCR